MPTARVRCSVVKYDRKTERDVRCEHDDTDGRLIGLLSHSPMFFVFKRTSGLRFMDGCGRICPVCWRHFRAGAANMLRSATSRYLAWMYDKWTVAALGGVGMTNMNRKYVRALETGRVF